jgi:hypothetical protein
LLLVKENMERLMAQRTKNRKWVAQVKTDSTHPPAGLFKENASTIARALASSRVSPKGPQSGLRMLNYFINRAGRSLSRSRRSELERAKSLPGKVRLPKEAHVTVQQIYYPGFTIAGLGEFSAFIAVALLHWSTPRGTVAFWLALGALLGVLAVQGVYWIAIRPSNKFWLQGKTLSAAGSRFFSFDPTSRKQDRSRQPCD